MTTRDKSEQDSAVSNLQKQVDAEIEAGCVGVDNDPTPNEHYTVAGVIAGKPTPETDPEHARKVRAGTDHLRGV